MKWLISGLVVFSCVAVQAATFDYQAYVAGVKAGRATIHIDSNNDSYEVFGSAKAEGLIETFDSWHTRFAATGRFVAGIAELIEYRYTEKGDKKRREVTVRDGELHVTKNGKKRPTRPAYPGVDVLTALYVNPSCREEQLLHTGRHYYVLKRVSQEADVCTYHVTDDDGDSYNAEIVYGERGNLTVPLSIKLSGMLTGHLKLIDP